MQRVSFFYLCANQTWHASDLSTLCRVFSTRCFRIVIHTVGNGFLFIYFHICKFRAILIENEVYFCPIKQPQKQPQWKSFLNQTNLQSSTTEVKHLC